MVGKIINGKYKVTEKLGTGGSSEVYKAYHVQLKTPWALKVVLPQDYCILNEVEVLKNLNHPAFPRLVDVIAYEERRILVFDYYEGLTLQKVTEQYGRIDESTVCNFAIQILDALLYLHHCTPEPIIYRDLKPSNLMLLPDDSIKVIDFGTARLFKQNQTDDTVYLGTPGYAAPEQYGLGQTDERTDIYNFGMTLFHLVTGNHPLQCCESQIPEILNASGVSSKLSIIVLKCISKDPQDRYSSISEIKADFGSTPRQAEAVQGLRVIGKNAVEISITGIQAGVGVTHFCMLFGMWLKHLGFRTAILEYGENRDMTDLCKLVEKESQVAKNGCFQIQGLSIFPSMGKDNIDGFQRSEYDYVLLDYGVHDEYVSMMMRRSDVRLFIASGADWKLMQLGLFLKKHGSIFEAPNTYLLFPLQNQKSIHIIQSHFRIPNMIPIPYAMNPWKVDNQTKKELETLYEKLFQVNLRKKQA